MSAPSLFNFRDVGGLRTADGKTVRTGVLYRAGDLALTPEKDAAAAVTHYGLRTYLDFRTRKEIHRDGEPGSLIRAGIKWRKMPLDPVDEVFKRLSRPTSADWTRFYLALFDRHVRDIATIVDIIAESEGALVMGCSAGKDRTGIVTATVLTLVGIDRAQIVADYARTTELMAPHLDRFDHLWRETGRDKQDIIHHFFVAHPEIMDAFLKAVDERAGGVEKALRKVGLADGVVEKLKTRLLGTAGAI